MPPHHLSPLHLGPILSRSFLKLDDSTRVGGDGGDGGAGAPGGDAPGVEQPRHGRHGAPVVLGSPALVLLEGGAGARVPRGPDGEEVREKKVGF